MPKYPYPDDIEVSKLRLDLRNPRLPNTPDSQREAYGQMAEGQGPKLLVMAKHIARHGLNPAQRFIVIPDDDSQYIVLDANRRLAVLRALEQPDLIKGRVDESVLKQLKQLSENFEPPDDVPCIVFAKREDADHWIELIHQGESEGAGLVEWSAQQKGRHRARSDKKSVQLQVLDFVRSQGSLSADAMKRIDRGTYPVSTLERALTTPYVRERLGIDVAGGEVVTDYPKPEVLKGLTRLVDEIGTGVVKVAQFMSVTDRRRYVDRFKAGDLPDPDARMEAATVLDQAPDKGQAKAVSNRGKDNKQSNKRTKLIPPEFSVAIDSPRLNDIYLELKRKLRVDDVPNATGALLRVFVELSVDNYIERLRVPVPQKDRTLANKVIAVVDYMVQHETLTDKQAVPVREAVKSGDKVSLVTNLNALIHNPDMTVSGNDLKALWNRLQTFSGRLWQDEQ
jgi:hypothetical protein